MDKWYQRSVDRFLTGGYYDTLLMEKDSPYYQSDSDRELNDPELISFMEEGSKLGGDPKELADFVYSFYKLYKLDGQIFSNCQRFCRALPAATVIPTGTLSKDAILARTIDILQREPKCAQALLDRVKSFKADPTKFLTLAATKATSRGYGGKDRAFLSKKLSGLGYIPVSARTKMEKNIKSFLEKNWIDVLSKLGISRVGGKSPDLVVRNDDRIYVLENKFQVEPGGSQNLSQEDGMNIFSYHNNSTFRLKTVFVFDGNYSNISRPEIIDLLGDNNRIMSILDVVDYIESGE